MSRQSKRHDGCSTEMDGKKVKFPSCLTCPLPRCRFEVNGSQSSAMLRHYLAAKREIESYQDKRAVAESMPHPDTRDGMALPVLVSSHEHLRQTY